MARHDFIMPIIQKRKTPTGARLAISPGKKIPASNLAGNSLGTSGELDRYGVGFLLFVS